MRLLGLLIILAFFTTCRPIKTLNVTPNGYSVLPKELYSFKDTFTLADTAVLSTTAIYYCCSCKERPADFLKFFTNGTVVRGHVFPVDSVTRRVYYTTGGYYYLQGNLLKIELPQVDGNFFSQWWDPIVYTGYINGDTIAFSKAQWFGKGPAREHVLPVQKPGTRRCDFLKSTKNHYFNLPDY
jgi:hypothetical protein